MKKNIWGMALAALFFSCSSEDSDSLSSVSGVVTENIVGSLGLESKLSDVSVAIARNGIKLGRTSTNASGNYKFYNLTSGQYTLTFSKDGYQSSDTTVTFLAIDDYTISPKLNFEFNSTTPTIWKCGTMTLTLMSYMFSFVDNGTLYYKGTTHVDNSGNKIQLIDTNSTDLEKKVIDCEYCGTGSLLVILPKEVDGTTHFWFVKQ